MLAPLRSEAQQDVLDEFAARMEETSVVSPNGLLIELIARAQSGTFNLSRGRRIGLRRQFGDGNAADNPNAGPTPESPFMNSVNWAYQQFRVDEDEEVLKSRLREADARWPDEARLYRQRSRMTSAVETVKNDNIFPGNTLATHGPKQIPLEEAKE
jgi:hypothetical protein